MDFSEINAALSGMDPAEVALGAGLLGVLGTLLAVGGAVWFFVSAIGYFKMLQKAGLRGWFAFIPILRDYALFRMSWTMKAFIVNVVLLGAFQLTNDAEGILKSIVALVSGIAVIVVQAKLVKRIAQAFGKGKGWAAFLFFVPFVASLILGFGSAEYLGNPEEKKTEGETTPSES
jgi:hypothetical protein